MTTNYEDYRSATNPLIDLLPLIPAISIVVGILYRMSHKQTIWLEGPEGTLYELPLKQGLRILNKRKDWILADVIPVRMTKLTRWQHFKKAIMRRCKHG